MIRMIRMWKVRERLVAISAGIAVLAASATVPVWALPGEPQGIPYTAAGHTTMLYLTEGQAAIAYAPGASIKEMKERLRTDAATAGWEILRPMPDYGMAIVKTSPEKASQQAAVAGVPLVNTYPVFHVLSAPDLPIVATEQVFVRYEVGLSPAERNSVEQKYSLQLVSMGPGEAWKYLAPVSGAEVIELTEVIEKDSRVMWSEPNLLTGIRLDVANAIPNDPYIGNQWHIENKKYNTIDSLGVVNSDCDVYRYWQIAVPEGADPDIRKGKGIVVAVIDSGVDPNHEDLRNNLVQGWDFVDDDGFPTPDPGDPHGTEVSGVIAAESNNSTGVSGIAPKAKIMPIRIFSEFGVVDTARIALAVRFAVDERADVVNNSWGGPVASSLIQGAFEYGAKEGRGGKGIISLASAGNEFTGLHYPAAYSDSVISVGAVSDQDLRISYSNAGVNLDVVAPSQDVQTNSTIDYIDFSEDPPLVFRRLIALPFNQDRTGIWTTDIMGSDGSNPGGTTDFGDLLGNYTSEFNGTSASCPVAAGCVAILLSSHPEWSFGEMRERIRLYADAPGDIGQYFDPHGTLDRCHPKAFSMDLGAGRINPYRSEEFIQKPFPFRNIEAIYDKIWIGADSPDGWTTDTLGPFTFPVVLAIDEEDNLITDDNIGKWVLTGTGWVETPPYDIPDEELPNVPNDVEDDYPYQGYLQNPDGRYIPGTDQALISPEFSLEGHTQQYAMLVLSHRFSMETLDYVELPNGLLAHELDEGRVELSYDSGPSRSWSLKQIVRGTTASYPDYVSEDDTVTVDQFFPLGRIPRDAGVISVRIRFMSNSLHNPFVGYGWNIQRTKLVLYDINDDDYLITTEGQMPDWSSDSRSIYFANLTGEAMLFNQADQMGKWDDGVECPMPKGYFLGFPEFPLPVLFPMTGLDFHPETDRLVTSINNAVPGGFGTPAVQTMNSDVTDGQALSQGLTINAQGARYSSDGNWVVFTDGLYSLYIALSEPGTQMPIQLGSSSNPLRYSPPDGSPSVQLTNIGHPVFAFDDQRIIFDAGTIAKPTSRDLYILHRATRQVERRLTRVSSDPGAWTETDEAFADVGIDSRRLVFVSDADSEFGEPGTDPKLFVLNNLESVVLAGSDPEMIPLDATLPDGYTGPPEFGWPRFSPDNERLVYTLGDTVRVRKLSLPEPPVPPNPTPFPTPTPPVATPTPVPTPIEETVTFDGQIDLSVGGTGWNLQGTSEFTSPTLTLTPGIGHTLHSVNNQDTFGYLASPFGSASVSVAVDPISGGEIQSLTLMRWWVSGSVSPGFFPGSAISLPDFRLRATSIDNQDTQLLRVESKGDGSLLPSLNASKPTPYDLLLVPAPGVITRRVKQESFNLAFDLMNWDATNDPKGALTLHRIEFYRIPGSIIKETELPSVEFKFDTGAEGWGLENSGSKGQYDGPYGYVDFGSLNLSAGENSGNVFGYYFKNDVPTSPSTSVNRLLRFDWTAWSFEGLDPTKIPSMRLRAATTDFQMQAVRLLSSEGAADLMPFKVDPYPDERIYTTFLRPVVNQSRVGRPPVLLPDSVNVAFDMLKFNPNDNPNGHLALSNLKISIVEIPDYPPLPYAD